MTKTKPQSKIPDDLKRNEVLALDVAEHTGYYSTHGMGTWNFAESAKNDYKQHLAFRNYRSSGACCSKCVMNSVYRNQYW